jgi:hypothetical protein
MGIGVHVGDRACRVVIGQSVPLPGDLRFIRPGPCVQGDDPTEGLLSPERLDAHLEVVQRPIAPDPEATAGGHGDDHQEHREGEGAEPARRVRRRATHLRAGAVMVDSK